jgi:autophagy-related protein 9
MMASNLLSRLLPSATDEPFEDDPLNPQPRRSSTSTDGQRDMDIDEENFGAYFEPQDLELPKLCGSRMRRQASTQ